MTSTQKPATGTAELAAEHERYGVMLWTAKDVAKHLQVSRSWVYLHAEDGTLPSVKIGGLLRFIPAEIQAFVLGTEVPVRKIISLPGSRGR